MRRGPLILAVLGALAVTAMWWVFIVSPRASETSDVEANIEAEQIREATLRQQIANLQGIKDQEVSYLFAIGQMESAIPELPMVDTFLEELNFLASRTGVTISQVSLATPIPSEDDSGQPLAINVTMTAEGQYFEMLGFLYGLEAMERLVRVETMSLRPVDAIDDGEEEPTGDEAPDNLAEGPRPRPDVTTLEAGISGLLFTRTDVTVDSEAEDPSTTTTTAPPADDGSTTTTTLGGDGE